MEVYIYKEYFDEDVYGEEIIKVFSKAEDAISCLKQRFIEAYNDYGDNFDEILEAGHDPETGFLDEDDTVKIEEDSAYISIGNGDGGVKYWIVEPHKVKETTRIPLAIYYSFDSEVPVFLFNTQEEALKELKSQFEEELRIQTEENGHVLGEDLETDISPDGGWASITIFYDDQKDVIEWAIGTIRN